jgi:SAM-dependent methyltransferase
MRSVDEPSGLILRRQIEEHPVIREAELRTARERVLHRMHERAYEEAAARAAGREILDVGCNSGYGTLRLAAVARRAVGVDVNPLAIEGARRRPGGRAVEFLAIDGSQLPFPDRSFDMVVSFQVIEHVADPAPYLTEIARVLRPDGTALLTTPNAAIRLDPGMPPWNRFHVREYRAADLPGILSVVFDSVDIRGMFATPALYHIEFARVDAAHRRHTAAMLAARSGPWARLRARLRSRVGRVWAGPRSLPGRRLRVRWAGPEAPPSGETGRLPEPCPRSATAGGRAELGPMSTADFWYAVDDLDRALDLLAICQAPRRPRPASPPPP